MATCPKPNNTCVSVSRYPASANVDDTGSQDKKSGVAVAAGGNQREEFAFVLAPTTTKDGVPYNSAVLMLDVNPKGAAFKSLVKSLSRALNSLVKTQATELVSVSIPIPDELLRPSTPKRAKPKRTK